MSDHPTTLGGTCKPRFDSLRDLFAAKLESGEDLGASLAVNIDGEMVVDLWGGWADKARTAPPRQQSQVIEDTRQRQLAVQVRGVGDPVLVGCPGLRYPGGP